ncbi:hypothetical protein [Variovorax sp. dw_308]|uniref:hypothetical protein n=1 Tax=Variovorax sp. dw_308 TaxID=2721546 RepID=UPI001C443CCE|nr:hypothetical protein [Variovorax sp. dw_308]
MTATLRFARPVAQLDVVGVLLLAIALACGGWAAPRVMLACWLAAWWCALGLVMGTCMTLWIHALTGGRWGASLRSAAALLVRRRMVLLPLFIPVVLGLRVLYPWAAADGHAFDALDVPAFSRVWFSLPAVACRGIVYAIAWYWLAASALQPAISRSQAARGLIVHGLLGSLASVDLLMTLVPGWRSTGFPLLVLVSQALGGACALVAWTAFRRPGLLSVEVAPRVPLARDLGNLLWMLVMVWGYLGFMQFLVIWAENLPQEINWFVPRLQTGWHAVGMVLVATQLALPLGALLFRRIKDRAVGLGAVAIVALAAHALDTVWVIVPSVDAHALATWWLAPLCMAGMGLVMFSPMLATEDRHVRA